MTRRDEAREGRQDKIRQDKIRDRDTDTYRHRYRYGRGKKDRELKGSGERYLACRKAGREGGRGGGGGGYES